MTYKEKIVDIDCDRSRISVCFVCATCGACDFFTAPADEEKQSFCREHEKAVDYYDTPCNNFR